MIEDYWVWIVFVMLVVLLVASLVFLLLSTSPRKWMFWGISFGVYVVVCATVLWLACPDDTVQLYKQQVHVAQHQTKCKTEKQVCMQAAIAQKHINDSTIRNNPTLSEKERNTTLQNDIRAIDNCAQKANNNSCIQHTLDLCDDMIRTKSDTELLHQFRDFRATKDPGEVLNLCNSVASQ